MIQPGILIIFLLASIAFSGTSEPNFVFILTDDMSWTGLSVEMDAQIKESKSDFYQTIRP